MSQIYEIVVFTASQKQYADKIIAEIDPKKRISHLLNRDHCIIINKVYYLKNLKILGRDLKQIILVDVTFYNILG
jgi:CTD small phosphatase-like protein 2